jgi:hypothetical protein
LAAYVDNILVKAMVLFVGSNICNALVVPLMVLTVLKIIRGNAARVNPNEDKERRQSLENQDALSRHFKSWQLLN